MISRLKAAWRHAALRTKIFLTTLVIALLAIMIIGNVSYRLSKAAIADGYEKSYRNNLVSFSKVLDLQMDNIITTARSALNNSALLFALQKPEGGGDGLFSTKDQAVLASVSEELSGRDAFINSIAFADLTGHVYKYSSIGEGTYAFYQYYKVHKAGQEAWAAAARGAKGREVFYPYGIGDERSADEISLVKYLLTTDSGVPFGYEIINISKQILKKTFITANESYNTSRYFLITTSAVPDPIFFKTGKWSGGKDEEAKVLRAYHSGGSGKYLIAKETNTTTGWNMVNVIEKSELDAATYSIRMWMLALSVLMVVLSAICAKVTAEHVTHPLRALEEAIHLVGGGERHIEADFDDSEVGIIGSEFKTMVNDNLKLSERLLNAEIREKDAQILLLQSQINPHFLYNTLDSLYCLAIIHGDDQIADMILALSNTFKLSLNHGEKYLSVMDSIYRIEEYMKLQNMRFHDRFTLLIDIKREVFPEQILNFILQPFVENALIHGLEPKVGPGSIRLCGVRRGGDLEFTITDDGVGTDDEEKLASGYGIYNVKERIRLIYGEHYGVRIESHAGAGTRVVIRVPHRDPHASGEI